MYNLPSSEYYTQRNNKKRALSACGPTSYAMYLILTGWVREIKEEWLKSKLALDDYIMSLLETKEAIKFLRSIGGSGNAPWEWLRMYNEYLEPVLFGESRSLIDWDPTFDEVAAELKIKKPVMLHGKYLWQARKLKIIGHFSLAMDFAVDSIIIADPFGDYLTWYKSHDGYGIPMTREQFSYHIKNTGSGVLYPQGDE